MVRLYHVEAACVAADCDRKWLDNVLSRFGMDGVESGGRGRARRISLRGLRQIVVIRELALQAGVPLVEAVRISARLLADGAPIVVGAGLAIRSEEHTSELQSRFGILSSGLRVN